MVADSEPVSAQAVVAVAAVARERAVVGLAVGSAELEPMVESAAEGLEVLGFESMVGSAVVEDLGSGLVVVGRGLVPKMGFVELAVVLR